MADKIKEPEGKTKTGDGQDGSDTSQRESEEGTKGFESENPELKGKSPEEIEALFNLSRSIVDGQKKKLDNADRRVRELESTRPKPGEGGGGDKKSTFFDDPDKALRDAIAEQIQPLREELTVARRELGRKDVHDDLRRQHKDWDEVWPWVKGLLDKQDFPNPDDPNLLGTLYYTAKGMMLEQGFIKPEGADKVDGDGDKGNEGGKGDSTFRGASPQHRSSPPPPAPRGEGKTKEVSWDDLDETERQLCKFYGQTPAEFVEFRDIEADEVIDSRIGMKKEA